MEENNYYPFGLKHQGYNNTNLANANYKYKYNGKELQTDLDINLYDYGARNYDPAIGRWFNIDPLADEFENFSPYNYVLNNPIRMTDPDGMAPDDIIIRGQNNSSVTIKTDLIDISVNAGSLIGDLGGNYTLNGADVLTAALDIVGIFDPTGAADVAAASLEASQGNWWSAAGSALGVVPIVGDAIGKSGKIGKHVKTIEKAIDGAKSADNAKALLKQGRSGKQERLTELMTDPKLGKSDKGWLKQEKNQIDRGKRTSMRNPPGKDLAHERGREAAKGYSYKHSNLQNRKDHRNQHKYDNNGKKNKERPIQ